MLFDLSFQRARVFRSLIKYDVAAGDECLDIREADICEQTAEIIHFNGVAANINRAQKGYVLWHHST